jgi:DNA-binding transcriptional regulator YdaS (Cro superfamily)
MEGMRNDPLQRAAKVLGSFSELARALGESNQTVFNWRTRQVPLEKCPLIEKLTRDAGDPVTREQLRPDVDWNLFR